MEAVLVRAREEAVALAEGGAGGVIVENFGDVPFGSGPVGPETVAAMTLAVDAVRAVVGIPVGINVLRNDPSSALAIAVATGASFIRVNVHHGAMVADEGLLEGRASETLRFRRALGVDTKVSIFADVLVKHAAPLGNPDIGHVAMETAYRALADALIVTGPATGMPADLEDVGRVKAAVPDVAVLVGSGVSEGNVQALLAQADGAIVGTSLKVDGLIQNQIDPERVKRLARLIEMCS